jgi:hypothetical protein
LEGDGRKQYPAALRAFALRCGVAPRGRWAMVRRRSVPRRSDRRQDFQRGGLRLEILIVLSLTILVKVLWVIYYNMSSWKYMDNPTSQAYGAACANSWTFAWGFVGHRTVVKGIKTVLDLKT